MYDKAKTACLFCLAKIIVCVLVNFLGLFICIRRFVGHLQFELDCIMLFPLNF